MKKQNQRMDANEALFAQRQIEFVSAKVQMVKYPQFKQRSLIPVNFEVNSGAKSYVYYQYDMIGFAKVIGNYAKDFPRVTLKKAEFTSTIKSLGDSYGYTIQDIRAAMMAGLPLETNLAMAAKRGILQKEKKIAFYGDDDNDLGGFFSDSNIPSASVTNDGDNSGVASTRWIYKTPDQILRDMNDLVNGIVDTTNEVEVPDTLILPVAQYSLIASTRMGDGSDTTILKMFLMNSPYIKDVVPCIECKEPTAGWTDVGLSFTGDIMVAYRRDPEVLELIISQEFEQFPPEREGLEWEVDCHERIGGTVIRLPLAINIGEGI